jgi:alanyl-tRNA synthetase
MRSEQLRTKFFDFFLKLEHQKVISAPLIPAKDPTLLFTNAGMNQFKDYFIGKEKRNYDKAVSIQKCLRVSGKHNDFDEVGKTAHHHTFFEMMGNFSFGRYFKKEAVQYSWNFLTKELGLPKEKLWITVYKEDDEAYDIWKDLIKIPPEKILKMGEKDNFWQMGDIGPCGPCSEIHYDRGEKYGDKDFLKSPQRFVEIWNLVFMQFNRLANGKMTPLAKPSIDTGMGLERLTAVMQGVESNYDTDLFIPIKKFTADLIGKDYLNPAIRIDLNIIADHARAIAFLISDAILPSNEGRGYVLRRILRRAARHGKNLGLKDPFISKICMKIIQLMNDFYPELESNKVLISQVVEAEEVRFNQTLLRGLGKFENILLSIKNHKDRTIPGEDLFTLSDTYGFPLDFATDLASEYDLKIDYEGFNKALTVQRERSLRSRKVSKNFQEFENLGIPSTTFCGYSSHSSESIIQKLFYSNKQKTVQMKEGCTGIALFQQTPFYAESGGQIADIGTGKGERFFIEITNVQKVNNHFLHFFKVIKGEIKTGDQILLTIDRKHRTNISIHHTITHILHWALRELLGLHVKQAGSNVRPDRLRFDYTHYKGLSDKEIRELEILVNRKIQANQKILIEQLSYEEALNRGAIAIFDEKYSDVVRMITVGDFSKELCGGTHLEFAGQAGCFRITEESSISAGIRRIEAKAGIAAVKYSQNETLILRGLASYFKQKPETLLYFLSNLDAENRKNRKKLNDLSSKTTKINLNKIIENKSKINNIPVTISFIGKGDRKQLGALADSIKSKIGGIAVLFTNLESKSLILVSIESKLTAKFNANNIIKDLAVLIDGRGGGKDDFAQAGGNIIENAEELSTKIFKILSRIIENP